MSPLSENAENIEIVLFWLSSSDLMTGVPLPGRLLSEGPEVRRADVGDGRGEPEEPPGDLLPVRVLLPLSVGSAGQTVLFHGALEQGEGFVLQVCGGDQLVDVGLQVGLFVSADHGGDVSVSLPRTEDVPERVVVTLHQLLLVPPAGETTDQSGQILPPEPVCLEVLGDVAQAELSADHDGLPHSPAVPTSHPPDPAIKAELQPALPLCPAARQPHKRCSRQQP